MALLSINETVICGIRVYVNPQIKDVVYRNYVAKCRRCFFLLLSHVLFSRFIYCYCKTMRNKGWYQQWLIIIFDTQLFFSKIRGKACYCSYSKPKEKVKGYPWSLIFKLQFPTPLCLLWSCYPCIYLWKLANTISMSIKIAHIVECCIKLWGTHAHLLISNDWVFINTEKYFIYVQQR